MHKKYLDKKINPLKKFDYNILEGCNDEEAEYIINRYYQKQRRMYIGGLVLFTIVIPTIILLYDIVKSNQPELPIKTSLECKISEESYISSKIDYSKKSILNFDGVGLIKTLYIIDKNANAYECFYTENDQRFLGKATTYHMKYGYIMLSSREKLKEILIEENFKEVAAYKTGTVYAINKEKGKCLFVLIAKKEIIYGVANCKYQMLFRDKR